MDGIDPGQDRRLDRRTLLKRGLLMGGLVAGAGLGIGELTDATGDSRTRQAPGPPAPATPSSPDPRPNILVIMVDQLRYPQWSFAPGHRASLPPNLRRLRQGAVSFSAHYAAANDCTPARAALLTGLYTHQTGCMITGGSTLDPGFPTWGKLLREHGYSSWWYGKWHLTHRDHRWTNATGSRALERYGFSGGTFPSPDGAPGQGWRVDPHIVAQFEEWFAQEGAGGPWCTTVSLVNPHDIAWWYVWSDKVAVEASAASVAQRLPPNFETPQQLIERGKPRLQRSLQDTAAASFGPVPFEGPEARERWLPFIDLYDKLAHEADAHVGRILRTLHSRPEVAARTVVLFTSDHGEYAASHGLRGKGAGAYEEAIRVPLLVKDPRGLLTRSPELPRYQLSSSVDIAPLLLTIASGSNAWRREARYAHLADRLDLAGILADPNAPGRPYVLHATDEIVTEYAVQRYAADAPLHVVALRSAAGKLATYSNWSPGGIEPLAGGQESELYDYSTPGGRLEIDNRAGDSPLAAQLHTQLQSAFAQELRRPLPGYLAGARRRGLADYLSTATRAAAAAIGRRRRRSEGEVGPLRAPLTDAPRAHGGVVRP